MAEQKNILDAIAREVVVFDGAMGTTLQRMQLAGDLTVKDFDGRQGCNEVLSLTRPDVVAGVHRSYLEVGCDVVETNSFGASRPKLDEFDLGAKVAEVNRSAARIAREEADRAQRADGRPRFVAGSLRPSGVLRSTGAREMVAPLRALAEHAPLPLSCQPNAGIPENREGVAVYPLQPGDLAEHLARFVRDFRLSIVGGCCGTTPVHLQQVVAAIRGTGPARKPPRRAPMLSSGLKAAALHQEPPARWSGCRASASSIRCISSAAGRRSTRSSRC